MYPMADYFVYELTFLVFGYRLVERYLHTKDDYEKRSMFIRSKKSMR
ncbi:Uncharacterised protein [Actinobacillus pleuropneumoniae]|nr:Uncharacterised protein [Actinobacillus pleuropneumoniae]